MSDRLHPAAWDAERLLRECRVQRQRRSGPGGQHRNKVETAVVLIHIPSSLRAEASERRSQEQNRQVALFRLRVNLALQLRRTPATDDTPSVLWRSRCTGGRLTINPSHSDFPALLAEALDVLTDCGHDLSEAASRLRCSPSQLTRLLKLEPRALQWVNQQRQLLGRRRLH